MVSLLSNCWGSSPMNSQTHAYRLKYYPTTNNNCPSMSFKETTNFRLPSVRSWHKFGYIPDHSSFQKWRSSFNLIDSFLSICIKSPIWLRSWKLQKVNVNLLYLFQNQHWRMIRIFVHIATVLLSNWVKGSLPFPIMPIIFCKPPVPIGVKQTHSMIRPPPFFTAGSEYLC